MSAIHTRAICDFQFYDAGRVVLPQRMALLAASARHWRALAPRILACTDGATVEFLRLIVLDFFGAPTRFGTTVQYCQRLNPGTLTTTSPHFPEIFARVNSLQELVLSGANQLLRPEWLTAMRPLRFLISLDIRVAQFDEAAWLEPVASSLPSLEVLDISFCKFNNCVEDALKTIARINRLRHLTATALIPLATDAPAQRLSNGFAEIINKKGAQLETLNIGFNDTLSHDVMLSVSERGDCLNSLTLDSIKSVQEDVLSGVLSKLRFLTLLSIDHLSTAATATSSAHLTPQSLQNAFSSPSAISGACASLGQLSLKGLGVAVDDGVCEVLGRCLKSLWKIELSALPAITHVGLGALAGGCFAASLVAVTIKLEACAGVTNLNCLTECATKLSQLLVDGCAVDDDGVSFLQHASNLTVLELNRCARISDRGLCHLGASGCHRTLTKLSVKGCPHVSVLLFATLHSFKFLEWLEIDKMPRLDALVQQQRSVSAHEVATVTKYVRHLQHCPSLRRLHVAGTVAAVIQKEVQQVADAVCKIALEKTEKRRDAFDCISIIV